MATTTSVPFTLSMYPLDWPTNAPNFVLGISGLVTTSYTFNLSGQVMDSNLHVLGTLSLINITGQTYIGCSPITWSTANFPITISGTVTVNDSVLNLSKAAQHALGAKGNSGVPVSYQTSIFCNDGGNDNDWNDFVLNFQLFNNSTD